MTGAPRPQWLRLGEGYFTVEVSARPGSGRRGFLPIRPTGPVVALNSAPEKGRANRELIEFIAEILDVPIAAVSIIKRPGRAPESDPGGDGFAAAYRGQVGGSSQCMTQPTALAQLRGCSSRVRCRAGDPQNSAGDCAAAPANPGSAESNRAAASSMPDRRRTGSSTEAKAAPQLRLVESLACA